MQTPEPGGLVWPPVNVPPELAAILRSELPVLADEIFEEIRRTVPEYGEPASAQTGQVLRAGIELTLTTFADLVEDPETPLDTLADACVRFGQWEARERGTLEPLSAAHRIGIRMAWQHAQRIGYLGQLPSEVVARVADSLFGYLDLLIELCKQGYLQEKAQPAPEGMQWRARLLGLILERPPVPRRAINELAAVAGWTVPDQVTMVAIESGPPWVPALPYRDLLPSIIGDPQPHLLVPGPMDPGRREQIGAALGGRRAAAGLTVPLAAAADSLRWARQALALADAGIIGDAPMVLCEEHLVELWLHADKALIDRIADRQLTELTAGGEHQEWFAETLAAWLETWGSTARVAERLGIHPQTVRYRIGKIEAALGDRLDDPEARFAMSLALRASRLR